MNITSKRLIKELKKDTDKFAKLVSNCIKKNQNKLIHDVLDIMEKKHLDFDCLQSYQEGDDMCETLLHIAVKYEMDSEIIERMLKNCPDLLSRSIAASNKNKGQTPLHIAITRGNEKVTELLLSQDATKKTNWTKLSMIYTKATGRIFANTVMMGELPLSVAALTFRETIVNILLEHGAEVHAQNSLGDTVLHSLVKYAAVYPDKTEQTIVMINFFIDLVKKGNIHKFNPCSEIESDIFLEVESYILFLENNDHLTPLQLSAKLGVVEIFQFIIKLDNIYSFVSTQDGLFDVKMYDISEIDTVAHLHVTTAKTVRKRYGNTKVVRHIDGVSHARGKMSTECASLRCNYFHYPKSESILEMMFDFDFNGTSAFRIIETIPVKNIIQEKWRKLRYVYFTWGFIHMLLMACMTAETVIRSDVYYAETITVNVTESPEKYAVSSNSKEFADNISFISFAFGGVFYGLVVVVLLIAKIRRPNAMRYCMHNLGYICFLFAFSVCTIVDFIYTQVGTAHDNIALILAVVAGWWFAIFFLRALRLFSFFTEMIRRVLIGDLLRFAVIIFFMLIAFANGIYAAFIGKLDIKRQQSMSYSDAIEQNFSSFGQTILTMFKLMLGLSDIDILNEARMPGLAIALYVVFILLTFVLLINSLIAMMSQTCAIILEDKYPQWRLQQLSVILFIEDLLCFPCLKQMLQSPGEERKIQVFDLVSKEEKKIIRYFFKIHSLQTTYASEEDQEALKKKSEHLQINKTLESLRIDTGQSINSKMFISKIFDEEISLHQRKEAPCKERGLVNSEKVSQYNQQKYALENEHETESKISLQLSNTQSLAKENLNVDSTPNSADHKNYVHTHMSTCQEKRKCSIRNNFSRHVDIEPYPNEN